MLSCKETTELASKALDTSLPLKQRIQVRLHLFMCKICSEYVKQLRFLKRVMEDYDHRMDIGQTEGLSDEARERIRSHLKQHL